jgi:hypothetical protein
MCNSLSPRSRKVAEYLDRGAQQLGNGLLAGTEQEGRRSDDFQ